MLKYVKHSWIYANFVEDIKRVLAWGGYLWTRANSRKEQGLGCFWLVDSYFVWDRCNAFVGYSFIYFFFLYNRGAKGQTGLFTVRNYRCPRTEDCYSKDVSICHALCVNRWLAIKELLYLQVISLRSWCFKFTHLYVKFFNVV